MSPTVSYGSFTPLLPLALPRPVHKAVPCLRAGDFEACAPALAGGSRGISHRGNAVILGAAPAPVRLFPPHGQVLHGDVRHGTLRVRNRELAGPGRIAEITRGGDDRLLRRPGDVKPR